MERSDWLIRKLGGWSKPPPEKALEGLYGQTRGAVIGSTCFLMTPYNIGIYSGVKRFF